MYEFFFKKSNIYKDMSKIIKLTESDIVKIVKKVLNEQKKDPLRFDTSQLYSDAESTRVDIKPFYDPKTGKSVKPQSSVQRTVPKTFFVGHLKAISEVIWDARNKSWDQSTAKTLFNNKMSTDALAYALLSWTSKNKNFNKKLFVAAISIILRESKSSAGTYLHYKEILGFIDNLFFGANHSQGFAQIQPKTAKEHNIALTDLYTLEGSFDAAYKILSSNYNTAKNYYSGNFITKFDNGKLIQERALGDEAALQMAVVAHNAGTGILGKWCETNIPNIANKCNEKERNPFKDDRVAITNTSKPIQNYFPNKGGSHNYIPQFKKSFDNLQGITKYFENKLEF